MTTYDAYDRRVGDAWNLYKAGRDPYGKVIAGRSDRETTVLSSTFNAGWMARQLAASGTESEAPQQDKEILTDLLDSYATLLAKETEAVLHFIGIEMAKNRKIRALEEQVRILGGDPIEAPLYRRISEQRKQLREKDRLIESIKDNPNVRYVKGANDA